MTALTSMLVLAIVFFVAHVILLFTSFGKNGYQKTRYLLSHVTLWICGAIVFLMAFLYAGKQEASVLNVFDTLSKQALIIALVLVLSLVAHTIVRLLVMPRYQVNTRK